MSTNKYDSMWLAFVRFEAEPGEDFNALIELDGNDSAPTYLGAWANVLVDSFNLKEAIDIIEEGLTELRFRLLFIQKIENIALLVEEDELKSGVTEELDSMHQHGYKFMISDRVFAYTAEED